MNPNKSAMSLAIEEAKKADSCGEEPVGALITHFRTGGIIVKEHNRVLSLSDPTAHAEILAIRSAGSLLGQARLSECDIIVSLEPCPMCAGAILNSRIEKVYFGCYDTELGACGSKFEICGNPNYVTPSVVKGGILEHESLSLIQEYFITKRKGK